MRVTLTFPADEPGTKPTVIRINDGKRSVPIEISGLPDENGNAPSIEIDATSIRLSRDFVRTSITGHGASGTTIEQSTQR